MKGEYKCKICGYVYDKELGDPISGIKERTLFKDILKKWSCSLCGTDTTEFEKIEE